MYWNPDVNVDADGEATISFYTSDILSKYRIVIEGLSDDGTPGNFTSKLVVK